MRHSFGIIATIAVVILFTLLPFFPGQYDGVAGPVSIMLQFLGKIALLVVPFGALWVASGFWSKLAGKQYGIATAALIASSVVWIFVSLGVLMSDMLIGLSAIAFWIFAVSRLFPRLKSLRNEKSVSPSAFYLLIVPVAVAVLQVALVAPAVEFSRNRAIRNSAQLIADIEQYRGLHGRYPASLLAVHGDYSPGLIGIREYQYEPSGDAYNLIFEQLAVPFGTREFVIYNPLDQQAMASHRVYRFQFAPQQVAAGQRLGHYAVHNAPHPHWKYFWFD